MINLESWYSQLGTLFQEYAHYNFPVDEAISVGRSDVPLDTKRVREATLASDADTFISEWPVEYGQQLGKEFTGGVESSIGQRQKLALARTFYRNPNVLILDEPTSSIDAKAKAKIFEKLESLPDSNTVLLISHRFSTVRKANKIVILEEGSIEEAGTHQELLIMNGTYARLFNLQAEGYK